METCVRGFSYMPENKVEVMDLEYIEVHELRRTWKISRRQRIKEQEQKIWDEFVKEQDMVKQAVTEDPYQFLHQLPETCLKELMEDELMRMKLENEREVAAVQDQTNQGEGDHPSDKTDKTSSQVVTFAEGDNPDSNTFHIFDDDNDLNDDVSGVDEDERCDSPSTVREIRSDASITEQKAEEKASDNVSSVIESSIYCARVKDLRSKLNDEILSIMSSLEIQSMMTIEREDAMRKCRRSVEFCARFNRIYMYQLQRQMGDIKRNINHALPFAQHTHFQSQMLRVVSLHQNLFQALQVFHKSLPQTSWLQAAGELLHGVLHVARDVTALCRCVRTPPDYSAAANLYDDDLFINCDKLDEAMNTYNTRVADLLLRLESEAEKPVSSTSTKNKSHGKQKKKRSVASGETKSPTKSWSTKDTDARLSMYSLETLRLNLHSKSSSSRENPSSVALKSKPPTSVKAAPDKPEKTPHGHRGSPRSRRPLMRAPAGLRAHRPPDTDIATMVQAVATCPSSHMSRDMSPRTPRHSPLRAAIREKSVSATRKDLSQSPARRHPRPALRNLLTYDHLTRALNKPARKKPNENLSHDKEYQSPRYGRVTRSPENVYKGLSPDRFEEEGSYYDTPREGMGRQCGHIGNPGKEDGYTGKECSNTVGCGRSSKGEDSDGAKSERDKNKASTVDPARYEVTRLLQQLCSGDTGSKNEKVTGAKNAQLLCYSSSPSRQPSTPQLLRILEETIQKQAPKPMYMKPVKNPERYRLNFNISEKTASQIFQYRTKFVQHMLTSPMYANSAVGKPWEMIGSVSEKIIDEVLATCAKEMQIKDVIEELYNCETN